MLLSELFEQRLTFAHAKEFIQDIEQSKGRIRAFIDQYPWLVQSCQDAVRQTFGNQFSVYRALTLFKPLRPEQVVSTTTDIDVAYGILRDAPGAIIRGDETIFTSHALLHYRIGPENVRVWIDHAARFVKQAIGKRTNHRVEDRYGELISIKSVLDWMDQNPEREIIADVTGLQPKVITFGGDGNGGTKLWRFGEYIRGRAPSGPVPAGWLKEFQEFLGETSTRPGWVASRPEPEQTGELRLTARLGKPRPAFG